MTTSATAATPRLATLKTLAENRQLTGLRGIASIDVMISHYSGGGSRWFEMIDDANLAVDLFFCLSAFMLCLVYHAGTDRKLDLRGFAVARIARLYPLYLVGLALGTYTILQFTGHFRDYHGSPVVDFVRQLLLVNVWPLIGNGTSWDGPSWSISVETLCYVAWFPLLFAVSGRAVRLTATQRAAAMLVLGFISYVAFIKFYNSEITYRWHGNPVPTSALWVLSVRGLAMFAAGWLGYLSYAAKDALAQAAISLTDALAVLLVLTLVGHSLHVDDRHMGVMLCPFLVIGLAGGGSWTARLLASRPVHYLGVISFSIYLLHMPLLYLAMFHFPSLITHPGAVDHPFLRVFVVGAVTLLAASVTYRLIEAPGRRVLRRLLGLRPRAHGVPSAG